DPVVDVVCGQSAFDASVAQVEQRVSFPRVGLPVVVGEFAGEVGAGESGEHAAGVYLGELCTVANSDEFSAGVGDGGQEAAVVAGADHAGLIKDEHAV